MTSRPCAIDRRALRRIRQLAEIVVLVEAGEQARADDLTRLHLAEFPDDEALVEPLRSP